MRQGFFLLLVILKLIPVFQMGGEVGTPTAYPGGLPVRQGRRRGRGLAAGPGPLPQVRGVWSHHRRSGKSHQEARSFREGGFCSGRKICSAREINNGKKDLNVSSHRDILHYSFSVRAQGHEETSR